uniref:Uncharacterized protein n=1 Tax=Zea mays TaxID=4577 RepID=B4FN20_MAIZE|nr:unknown [Zea mays]
MQCCNEEREEKRILSMCPEQPSFSSLLLRVKGDYSFSPFTIKNAPAEWDHTYINTPCLIIVGMLLKGGSRFSLLLLASQVKQSTISLVLFFPCHLRK